MIKLGYGRSTLTLSLDAEVLLPPLPPALSPQDLSQKTQDLLLPMKEAISRAQSPLLIVEDSTRPAATAPIVKSLLEQSDEWGTPASRWRILFASGAHGGLESSDMREKLPQALGGACVLHHDCRGDLAHLGTISCGIPLWVNPVLPSSDLIIGLGSITPHHTVGLSGGGKLILPGVSGLETILAYHDLPKGEVGFPHPVWESVFHEAADLAHLGLFMGCILRADGQITNLVAGDPSKLKEPLQVEVRSLAQVPLTKASTVLAGAGPYDENLFSTFKALTGLLPFLNPQGVWGIVAHCPQGMGRHTWRQTPRVWQEWIAQWQKIQMNHPGIIYSPNLDPQVLKDCIPNGPLFTTKKEDFEAWVAKSTTDKVLALPYAPLTLPMEVNP